MSKISLPGQTKIITLQKRFKHEFGLTLRIYSGRRLANQDETIGQVRTKKGETFIDVRRNSKVGNLEDRFMESFGIKVQIAGSDDSYLCDNALTLAAALKEDERKRRRRSTKGDQIRGEDSEVEFLTGEPEDIEGDDTEVEFFELEEESDEPSLSNSNLHIVKFIADLDDSDDRDIEDKTYDAVEKITDLYLEFLNGLPMLTDAFLLTKGHPAVRFNNLDRQDLEDFISENWNSLAEAEFTFNFAIFTDDNHHWDYNFLKISEQSEVAFYVFGEHDDFVGHVYQEYENGEFGEGFCNADDPFEFNSDNCFTETGDWIGVDHAHFEVESYE